MATGDMKNNFKQLQTELKAAKYSHSLDIDGLLGGTPQAYLGIYHYLFTTYSTKFNKDISNSNNELYGKSDMRFMEAVYKILRDMFDHKPQITREQFFSPGFAERKVIMATEILRLIRSRYKPPKSATFKVAATKEEPNVSPREKILKEPHERPRKIAHKTSPNVTGAIVLPVRAASGGGGYKITKSSGSGPRLSYEGLLFGSSVMHSKTRKDKHDDVERDEVEIVDVRATSPGHFNSEPIDNRLPLRDQESTDSHVRRKVVDLVSPALLKLNERLGKLELSVTNLEQRESPQSIVEPPPSSTALAAGLSKQMTDILFKVETLTSKVVLLENRLIMVEARLSDEENYRKVLSSSQSVLGARKAVGSSEASQAICSHVTHDKNNNHNNDQIRQTEESDGVKDKKSESGSEVGMKINSGYDQSFGNTEDRDETDANGDSVGDECAPAQGHSVSAVGKGDRMAFMKTLVNPNDTEVTVTTDASQLETMDKEDQPSVTQGSSKEKIGGTQMTSSLSSQPMSTTATPFDDFISPIRSYSGAPQFQTYQDESMLSIPCGRYEMDTSDDRRSSTPTHFTLDTSTLSRVNRINMMMTETQKLFN